MTLYITDNPEIKNKLKVNCHLIYQVFDWIINLEDTDSIEETNFVLTKRFKLSEIRKNITRNDKIVAIVAPSNYKLIYDLLYIKKKYSKEIAIFSWDSYSKRKRLKYDKEKVIKDFNKYIQRGYLTKITYPELSTMNLQRIEQFLVILAILTVNIVLKTGSEYGIEENYQELDPINDQYDNIDAIGSVRVMCHNGYTIRQAVDKLIYHSRKRDITDPFIGTFSFLKNNNTLFKLIENNKNSSLYRGSDKDFLKSNIPGITPIVGILNSIIPITDTLKTLRFLEKNDYIYSINEKGSIKVDNYEMSINDIKKYSPFLSSKIWNELYLSKGYTFSSLFPKIEVNEDKYECPFCGSTTLRQTPTSFFCSDILCKLYVNRVIKPCGVKKLISENELIRLLKHGNTMVKNKGGGYSRFILQKNDKKIWIIPQIEENISDNSI